MIHSSEKEYYCKECKESFKGPSFFKHLKSNKHYANYINAMDESDPVCDTARELFSDDSPLKTISSNPRGPASREHAANFMRSLHQFLDMWYPDAEYTCTHSSDSLRVSISISKNNHK